eukprot:scaffold131764_cov63-Phaeocystis_antarctica.AAC.1
MAAVIDVVASEAKKEAAREKRSLNPNPNPNPNPNQASEEAEEAEEEAEAKPRVAVAPPFLGSRPKFDWEMSFAEQACICMRTLHMFAYIALRCTELH